MRLGDMGVLSFPLELFFVCKSEWKMYWTTYYRQGFWIYENRRVIASKYCVEKEALRTWHKRFCRLLSVEVAIWSFWWSSFNHAGGSHFIKFGPKIVHAKLSSVSVICHTKSWDATTSLRFRITDTKWWRPFSYSTIKYKGVLGAVNRIAALALAPASSAKSVFVRTAAILYLCD